MIGFGLKNIRKLLNNLNEAVKTIEEQAKEIEELTQIIIEKVDLKEKSSTNKSSSLHGSNDGKNWVEISYKTKDGSLWDSGMDKNCFKFTRSIKY